MPAVPLEVYANNPSTTVSSGGTTGPPAAGTTETWTVASSASFPAATGIQGATQFHVADPVVPSEIITVEVVSGTTWTVVRGAESTTPVLHAANFTVVQVVTAGVLASILQAQYQFRPETHGAAGNGRILSDCNVTSGSNIITSAGIPAAAAPTLANAGTGGTVLAGTYQVKVTYVNAYGESLPSTSASTTTTGSVSTITITSPLQTADATGWYAYVTQAGGSTWTRQQTAGTPTPVGTNLTLTAPPSSSGLVPPGANTTPSNPFTVADVGKYVWIPALWLITTITGFTDSAHVTMAVNAGGTATTTGVAYGTDDTAAIQATINEATAYSALGGGRPAEVLFGPGIYCIAGPAVIGGATGGNSQITLPVVNQYAGNAELYLTGSGLQGLGWVTEGVPATSGTTLFSMRIDATVDGTYGYPFVIGGTQDTNNWSSMTLTVDKISVMVPGYNSATPTTYGGLGLNGTLCTYIKSFTYMPLAIEAHGYPNPSQTWPNIDGSLGNNIPVTAIGVQMPGFNNQAISKMDLYNCEWAGWALVGAEHAVITNMFNQYCNNGWAPSQGHGQVILGWSCQRTPNVIDTGTFPPGGTAPVFVGMISLETFTLIANDPTAVLTGTVYFQFAQPNGTNYGNLINTGANIPGLQVISTDNKPGPIISPPAVPASGTALGNYYYRDAFITVTGGTVSAVSVDGTATGLTLTSGQIGTVAVPSGHKVTLTYTVAPTWKWTLL